MGLKSILCMSTQQSVAGNGTRVNLRCILLLARPSTSAPRGRWRCIMADESKDSATQDVGYGKPPRHSRFQPGRSGNPKGRPRGSKNLAAVVLREARKRVRVSGPDGTRTATKVEASVMQLANQSAKGDLASQRQFLTLVKSSEESLSHNGAPGSPQESDQIVTQSILRRIREYKSSE